MPSLRPQAKVLLWVIAIFGIVLAIAVGCTAPRINVIGTGPTPSPTGSPTAIPTPTPIPTITPIPTLTPTPIPISLPTPMSATVAKQDESKEFLFTVSPDSLLMSGFKISGDGSLAPVPGSPFVASTPLHFAVSINGALVAASEDAIAAFAVDSETGSIRQTDVVSTSTITRLMPGSLGNEVFAETQAGPVAFRLKNGKLQPLPALTAASGLAAPPPQASATAVLTADGRFMFVVDARKGELAAFRVEDKKAIPLEPPTPVPAGTESVTLVKPQ